MSLSFFDVAVAESVGVNAAIIFQNLSYWCEKNAANDRHIHEGRAWTYNSNAAFAKLFPYLTENQIRTAIDKLIEAGLILTGNFNETAYDRTKWYSVKTQVHSGLNPNGTGFKPEPIPDKKPDNNQNKDGASAQFDFEDQPKVGDQPKPQTDSQRVLAALMVVLPEQKARDFIDHRQKLRKPMTPRAAEMIAEKLAKASDPVACAEHSIVKGWQDVFPDQRPPEAQRSQNATDKFLGLA
jgi:hypothetical protein